eukprot:Gb_19880 [translate_table: standard]
MFRLLHLTTVRDNDYNAVHLLAFHTSLLHTQKQASSSVHNIKVCDDVEGRRWSLRGVIQETVQQILEWMFKFVIEDENGHAVAVVAANLLVQLLHLRHVQLHKPKIESLPFCFDLALSDGQVMMITLFAPQFR